MTAQLHMAATPAVEPGDVLPEFGAVVLRRAVTYRGVAIPAGTRGIVVDRHEDGAGYEIEISAPVEAVLSLMRQDLT